MLSKHVQGVRWHKALTATLDRDRLAIRAVLLPVVSDAFYRRAANRHLGDRVAQRPERRRHIAEDPELEREVPADIGRNLVDLDQVLEELTTVVDGGLGIEPRADRDDEIRRLEVGQRARVTREADHAKAEWVIFWDDALREISRDHGQVAELAQLFEIG